MVPFFWQNDGFFFSENKKSPESQAFFIFTP